MINDEKNGCFLDCSISNYQQVASTKHIAVVISANGLTATGWSILKTNISRQASSIQQSKFHEKEYEHPFNQMINLEVSDRLKKYAQKTYCRILLEKYAGKLQNNFLEEEETLKDMETILRKEW